MSLLKISGRVLAGLALLMSFAFQEASASPSTKATEVRQTLREIAKQEKTLKKQLKGMSAAQRSKVLTTLPSSLKDADDDSDGDGLPDLLEHANSSNTCADDSDSDGSDDSAEFEDGTSPDDSSELEVKGTVSGLSGSSFTVATRAVSTNSSTEYRRGSVTDLIDGACVEVKIDATNPSALIATRVDFKNSDDCV